MISMFCFTAEPCIHILFTEHCVFPELFDGSIKLIFFLQQSPFNDQFCYSYDIVVLKYSLFFLVCFGLVFRQFLRKHCLLYRLMAICVVNLLFSL